MLLLLVRVSCCRPCHSLRLKKLLLGSTRNRRYCCQGCRQGQRLAPISTHRREPLLLGVRLGVVLLRLSLHLHVLLLVWRCLYVLLPLYLRVLLSLLHVLWRLHHEIHWFL